MPLADLLECFAIATPGIETLLAGELTALGIVPGALEPGGVEFRATRRQLADALLWVRTANRITVRVASFPARTFGELERQAGRVAWGDVLVPGAAVHFRVTSKKSKLYHHDAIAERLERAVAAAVDRVDSLRGAGAVADLEEADVRAAQLGRIQRIVVRVMRDEVTLSADAAGALLYLRGYRQAVAKAPLRETLAAALLLASGWTPALPLLDPMCGSGTIVIEAAMMAGRIAPGRRRRFAAEQWPGMAAAFAAARENAGREEQPGVAGTIAGSDRDAGAIAAAIANAERAGVSSSVDFRQDTISSLAADRGPGWLVTNPPYGARIGERTALRDLYATLGRMVRDRRPGWRLAMLSADRMLEGQLGMATTTVLSTTNGGLPVRVVTAR